MFSYANINQNLVNYVDRENDLETYNEILNDGSTQRERYFYKILDKDDFGISKNLLGITSSYKYKLNPLNHLLPNIKNKEKENILFLTADNIKDYNIGFTVVGKFRENKNGTKEINGIKINDAPDTIDIFLSKVNNDGTVTAWKRLNDEFPGLSKIYKGRESTKYITKNMYVSGKSKYDKGMGDIVTSTNSYNITTIIRTLLSKEESSKKIKNLIERIKNNDYSVMDFKALYNSSDAYHTQLNTLANGNLESLVFESSGIKDTDILSATTKVGERFLLKKKLNVDVFLDSMNQFKNESTKNRKEFIEYFKDSKNILTEEEIKENIKYDPIKDFKNKLVDFSNKKFEENIDLINQYKKHIKELQEKNPDKKIKIGTLLNKFKDSEDYLNQSKIFKNELSEYFGNDNKNISIYDRYISYEKSLEILDRLDKQYNPYIKRIKKEMQKVIKDRVEIIDFKKHKYLYKMSNNYGELNKTNLDIIQKQIASEYFNAYNEKFDLFQMLINRRKNFYISDMEKIASLVNPIFDNNKIVGYKINKRREYNKELINVSEKDLEFRYGFYKARNNYGEKRFDELSYKEQTNIVEEYLSKYKNLVKKAKTKSILGKYDSLENFEKTRNALKEKMKDNDNAYIELLSGDSLATTDDKVISHLNKDLSLEVDLSTFEKIDSNIAGMLKFHIKFNKDDGFEGNDLIKNMLAINVGELRDSSYLNQIYIQDKLDLIKKNNSLQNIIKEGTRKGILEGEMSRHMLSYLKGNAGRNKTYFGIDKSNNLVYIRGMEDYKQQGIKKITEYSDVYNYIIKELKKKNITQVFVLEDNTNTMKSVSELFNEAYEKDKKITNSLFMNLINRDDIVNFAGGGIQSSFIRGNSSLTSFGYTSPGIAFNKMTQRTFQSKDLLGEKTISVNGKEKSISLINAEILSKLNVGISIRKGKYVTEELLKDTINLMKDKYGINNKDYVRGEVFKTFAIGDFNTNISKDYTLDSFTASFQEGMTGSMALKNTTNAIRTKLININLDEINYETLGIAKENFEKMLMNKNEIGNAISNIIDKDLFGTIEGNKKLSMFYEDLEKMNRLNKNDSLHNLNVFYSELIKTANKYIDNPREKYKLKRNQTLSEDDITINTMKLLENIKFKLGAVVKPTTSKGKNIITNKEFVNKILEVKPEVGLSISNLSYDRQRKSIEILLENTASSDQGSKNQAIGAKYTISSIYDSLKIKDKLGKSYAVAGVFNNKTEKRAQTGMYIHGTLQTLFSNIYDKHGLEGVEKLSKNIKSLLSDLQVEVTVDKNNDTYFIDETYLTRDFNNNKITAEQFEEFLTTDGLENSNKLFTDRGKEIIEKVSKKYGSSYLDKNGEFVDKSLAHLGIVMEANRGYLKTFKDFNDDNITPFVIDDAEGIAKFDGKESILGKGSVLLMKMTTERVNSNASKKKESATKIGKEMMYMMKIGGYEPLVDFMRTKQKDKVTKALNDTFNIINLNSYLNNIYDRDGIIDSSKLINSLENNLDNSIVLRMSELKSYDYLLNSDDIYLHHNKLMDMSILGEKLKEKGLDILNSDNNRLANSVNVIIQDDTIESFYSELKSSLNDTINTLNEDRDIFLKKSLEEFLNSNNLDMKNINQLIKQKDNIEKALYKTKSKSLKKDVEYIRRFINILDNNKDDKFALSTLKTILKTGKIVSVVNLNYDIDEIGGTIVNSPELKKIVNIANNHNNYISISDDSVNILKKYDNKDITLIDDIIEGVSKNINEYSSSKTNIYTKIFSEINDDYIKNNHSNTYELINNISIFNSDVARFKTEKNAVNDMLEVYGKNLTETPEEIKEFMNEKEMYFEEFKNNLNFKKQELLSELKNTENIKVISGRLNNLLFGSIKTSNENSKKIMRNIENIIIEEGKEQVNTMFSSLNEYLKMPNEIANFTQKGSRVYEAMKYNVKSSFVANPIEGSGVLEEFKNITFKGAKSVADIESNLDELKMLLTGKIVNENLFIDDGINYLDELKKADNDLAFSKGLEKAKNVFGKNLSGINGITIMDSTFAKTFRKKDYLVKDIMNDTAKGITKELVFFSRYPQQTAQHFGSILNIGIDRNNITNKYAKAILPYLSNEKNQAGLITLGKKTMLTVRGDHDGDKVYITFLDFLDKNKELKQLTSNQMFMDFQLRNNKLSNFIEIDKTTGNVKYIKGNIFDFVDSNSMDNNVIDLSYRNLDEAYNLLNEKLGLSKTDINMKQQYFEDLDFRIGMRAFKELGKHNNSSYELMAKLTDVIPYAKNYTNEDLDKIENVLKRFNSEIDRGEKYVGRHLKNSDEMIRLLRIGERDVDKLKDIALKMDTISATVFFTHFKTKPKSEDELYKNTLKEIKNIDRGSFSKINVKTAKSIYEELTGIKNTGKTFHYASSIRNTSTELSEINPTSLLTSLGHFVTNDMSVEELETLKNMQKYFGYGIDSTIDNMIESAISAKHGLTLGGLEGTKIFTNLLLSPGSENLNDSMIKLFNDYVIKQDKEVKINTIEKLAKFSKTVSTINASFEDAYAEVEKQGLDKSIFQLVINNKNTLKSRHLTESQALQYKNIRDKFLGENFDLEIKLANEFINNKKMNRTEYQLFEGLSRIGEMLIQNEPGTEFDPDEVLSIIEKLKNNEITYGQFLQSHEIRLINSQLFSSLGSASAISAIGKTRKYAKAFVEKIAFDKAINYLNENLPKDSVLLNTDTETLLGKINKNFDIIDKKLKLSSEELLILDEAKKIKKDFIKNKIDKEIINPVSYFTEVINSSNSIFSNTPKNKEITSEILDNLYKGNGYSLNSNNLFDMSIKKSINESSIFNRKIIADYFGENVDLVEDIFVDETQSSSFMNNLNNILDSILFKNNKKNLKTMSYENFKIDSNVTGIFVKKELNNIEKEMFNSKKLIQVKAESIDDFLDTISDNKKYYLDDILLFYSNGKLDYDRVNRIRELYKKDNIFLSDKLLKKMIELDDIYRSTLITPEQEYLLNKDIMNAYKFLGEDVTETNVLKRLKNTFDYKLATKIHIDNFSKNNKDFFNGLSEEYRNSYLKRLENNLSNILLDFNNIEPIKNNYDLDESYLKLANIFTLREKQYRNIYNIENSKKLYSKMKKYNTSIDNFIKDNFELLKEIDADEELFKRYSLMSFLNNSLNDNVLKDKDIIRNSLKDIVNNDELFGRIEKQIIDPSFIKQNRTKLSLGTLLGTASVLLGKKIMQYLTNADKDYIVSTGNNSLTEEQILNQLNIGNGQTTNMINQELLNTNNIPIYINIAKKNF